MTTAALPEIGRGEVLQEEKMEPQNELKSVPRNELKTTLFTDEIAFSKAPQEAQKMLSHYQSEMLSQKSVKESLQKPEKKGSAGRRSPRLPAAAPLSKKTAPSKRAASSPKTAPSALPEAMETRRERQREVCLRLLERWVPVAASAELAVRSEGRAGPVLDEEPLEMGLKAGAFVLKVLERLARLDGVDTPGEPGASALPSAPPAPEDPVELARRVRTITPVLLARLARR